MKPLTILLASALCTLAAPPALGETPLTVTGPHTADSDTIRVPYGDLNLANPGDAATLRARVRHEARRVCGNIYQGAFLEQEWGCQDVAWQIAAPQIDAAIASASSGKTLARNEVVLHFVRR